MEYLFGIDIGGTTIKIGLVSFGGLLIDKFEIPTRKENNGNHILPDIRDAIYDFIERKNIAKNDIKGIGFGIPGPVSKNVVHCCVNLGWGEMNVKEEFEKLLDFNTVIACGNDANVAALGEMWVGSDNNYQNIVMLTLGTGVGGGIIQNGKPIDGARGAGGELGHMHIDNKHLYKCNCGLHGCLETVASATGVVRLAKEYLSTLKMESALKFIPIEKLQCKDVFDAAKSGDKLALKVVDEVGYYIGYACSIIAVAVDPEAIIIGGGVSKAGNILIESIRKHYLEFAFKSVVNMPFILASLGNDGGMLGAALLAKN